MTQPIDRASLALISELVAWAGRSLVLAAAAGAGLAAFRVRTASVRLFTWTSVLYAGMAIPVLVRLLPPMPVPTPAFLQQRIVQTAPHNITNSGNLSLLKRGKAASRRDPEFAASTLPAHSSQVTAGSAGLEGNAADSLVASRSVGWEEIASRIYWLVTVFFLVRLGVGFVLSRKLVRNARPITEHSADMDQAFHTFSAHPRLAESDWISVPVTVGVWRPAILLPADWRSWDSDKLNAVLAHELSHVGRRDALTQHLALLYRAIFWFNPLSWWLSRHLAVLAEEASDEAALSVGADQNHYARTLLTFFENLQATPGRIWWQGVSMARHGQAEQRLERILAWKGTINMSLKRSIAFGILALAIPVVYLTASIRPANVALAATPVMAAQSVPPVPAGPPVRGVTAPTSRSAVAGVAPVAAAPSVSGVTAVAPTAPVAAIAPSWGVGQSYHHGYDDEERFVIVSGKSDGVTMSGSTQDARHAEKLKKQIPGDFIWFQRDEKSYIIRDQATVDRARALWAPQEELGKKQEALGKQQEELGKQQEELGNKMQQVRVNVPDMTAALDKLKTKLQKLGPTATVDQIGELQSEIGELQSKIGEIQSQAGEEQSKLGELQGELGEKQGKLGEQQGELGRQQGELAEKATRQMKELLDEAIKNGTAKSEPGSDEHSML
jgi:beta-lactamase regulating signal transducer with metallopeptidase domain